MLLLKSKGILIVLLCLLIVSTIFGCTSNDSSSIEESDFDVKEEESTEESILPIDKEEFLLIVTTKFPPYITPTEDDKGFYPELITEIFARRGIDIVVEYYPWTRCVEMVKNHQAFATIPWVKSTERLREFDFSNNFTISKMNILYLEDNPKVTEQYDQKIDLKKYELGTINEYFYINELKALGFELDSTNTEAEAITKLYNGRYDVAIVDENVSRHVIEALYSDQKDAFAVMDKPYRVTYEALRTSKDYPNQAFYLAEFNAGLQEVLEDGTYESLMHQYNIRGIDVSLLLEQYRREPLIIGLEDYSPYEYVTEEGELAGIGYEIVREAICRMGYAESNYEFVVSPWSRIMEMGKKGDIDVILDAFYTEERTEQFEYSNEIYASDNYYFVALKHNNIMYDGDAFSESVKNIGIVRDYKYGKAIEERLKTYQGIIDEVSTADELVEGLLNGRYDVILTGDTQTKYYMKEHHKTEALSFLWKPLDTKNTYIMYPRVNDHAGLIEAIDEQIKEIRNDGTYEKIINYYIE